MEWLLLPLWRADELDLEAAAVGGLAMAMAGVVEVEDNFASETDRRLAHVLRLEAFRGLDHDLFGRGGDNFASVHHRLDRIVHLKRDLAVGTKREILALDDNLPPNVDLADLAALRMASPRQCPPYQKCRVSALAPEMPSSTSKAADSPASGRTQSYLPMPPAKLIY